MRKMTRSVMRWIAVGLVMCLCTSFIPFSLLSVEAQEAEDFSTGQKESNALDKEAYSKDFGLSIDNVPADFNDDESSDPLQGVEKGVLNELGGAYLLNGGKNVVDIKENLTSFSKGNQNPKNMQSKSDTGVDPNAIPDGTRAVNMVAADLNGEGFEAPVTYSLIEGKLVLQAYSYHRVNQEDIDAGRYPQDALDKVVNGAARTKEISSSMHGGAKDISEGGALGLVAIASGDYDNDGCDEIALYVPQFYGVEPYFVLLKAMSKPGVSPAWDNWDFVEIGRLKITKLNGKDGQFNMGYHSCCGPIVHLATTSMSGQDDLVINVSLPLKKDDDYYKRGQDAVMGIYSYTGESFCSPTRPNNPYKNYGVASIDGDYWLREKFFTILGGSGESDRMRFATAIETDLNNNGVNELVVGAHRNYKLSEDKGVGLLNDDYCLLQMFTFENGTYRPVWNYAKKVDGLDALFTQLKMFEPAALAAGRFYPADNKVTLFLEGVFLSINNALTTADNKSEADLFANANFTTLQKMKLNGKEDSFISQAVVGNFTSKDLTTQQLLVVSGDKTSKKVWVDVDWFWNDTASDSSGLVQDNYNNVVGDVKKDGTMLAFCPLDIDSDTMYYKYQDKSYGWSAPTPIAVEFSPPYWEELPYMKELLGKGGTSFSMSETTETSSENALNIGGGISVGSSVDVALSFLGTGISAGVDFDADSMIKSLSSHYQSNKTSYTETITAGGGADEVTFSAMPIVQYRYQMWVPQFTVNQEYIDAYNELAKQMEAPACSYTAGQLVAGHWEDYVVSSLYGQTTATMNIDEYNELAKKYEKDGVMVIDADGMYSHKLGDPTTYPTSITQISNRENDQTFPKSVWDGKGTPKNIPITDENISVSSELEIESATGESSGIDLAFGAGIETSVGLSMNALVVQMDAELQNGGRFEVGGQLTSATTESSGTSFTGMLSGLPSGTSENYNFNAQFVTWRMKLKDDKEGKASGPWMIGYLVNGTSVEQAPPSLPANPRVYATSSNTIVLGWDHGARKADKYVVHLKNNQGEWGPGYVVPGDENLYISQKHAPNSTQEFAFSAFMEGKDNSRMRESVIGHEVTAKTNMAVGPKINTPPYSTAVLVGESPTFAVEAEASGPQARLEYRWQKFERNVNNEYVGSWVDIPGATEPIFTPEPATMEMDKTLYRVAVDEHYDFTDSWQTVFSRGVVLRVYAAGPLPELPQVNMSISDTNGTSVIDQQGRFIVGGGGEPLTLRASVTDAMGAPITSGDIQFAVFDNAFKRTNVPEKDALPVDEKGEVSVEWKPEKKGEYHIVALYIAPPVNSQATTSETLTASSPPSTRSGTLSGSVGQVDMAPITTQLQYYLDGGQNAPGNASVLSMNGSKLVLQDPVKEGATFEGWFTDPEKTQPITEVEPQGELQRLYADFKNQRQHLNYELNGGENNARNPADYAINGANVKLLDPLRQGYAFRGWLDGSNRIQVVMAKTALDNLVLGATWEPVEYFVTFLTDDVPMNKEREPYNVETGLTLPTTSADGRDIEWYSDYRKTEKITSIPANTPHSMALYGKLVDENQKPVKRVDTGDSTDYMLTVMALLVSLGGLLVFVKLRKDADQPEKK